MRLRNMACYCARLMDKDKIIFIIIIIIILSAVACPLTVISHLHTDVQLLRLEVACINRETTAVATVSSVDVLRRACLYRRAHRPQRPFYYFAITCPAYYHLTPLIRLSMSVTVAPFSYDVYF